MFKFDNSHIFTGYLKQLLSSVNLPTCRVYTKEFNEYFNKYGKEDPRVIESFDNIFYTSTAASTKKQAAVRVNYLKANELFHYFWNYSQDPFGNITSDKIWKRTSSIFYDGGKSIPGLTKLLNSPGNIYDTHTHEYLGDYLRFLRDYHDINLMSLYNCFSNKIYNNIYYKHEIKALEDSAANMEATSELTTADDSKISIALKLKPKIYSSTFDSQDSNYRIYAFPAKLFANYTIAIDCDQGIELFCGLYTDTLETTDKGRSLIAKTYRKVNKTLFRQPFLYDALDVMHWNFKEDTSLTTVQGSDNKYPKFITGSDVTRWDIANREQDLKLFIKVPTSCKSSIVVLEGDFRTYNDVKYTPVRVTNQTDGGAVCWEYKQNHSVLNFKNALNLDTATFKPIGKLQLLALNTGESYPFADRLVEYLCSSAITPIDPITDNIKRAQRVMSYNQHYFKIEGLWEDKMQKIIYDYMMNSGPIELKNNKLTDRHSGDSPKNYGYHTTIGHKSKSALYDILGFVDRDAEKYYTCWKNENGKVTTKDTIQNVDIYDGLYDLE